MAFCSHCGTEIADGVAFCPKCGEKVGSEQAGANNSQSAGNTASDFAERLSSLNNTQDTTSAFDKADIEKNKGMAIVAYLSWLVIIPLLAAKDSRFSRFHANQGLVLAIFEAGWWVIEGILTPLFYFVFWGFGSVMSVILGLVNVVFLVLTIIGIINAANGRAKELPLIGKIKILK